MKRITDFLCVFLISTILLTMSLGFTPAKAYGDSWNQNGNSKSIAVIRIIKSEALKVTLTKAAAGSGGYRLDVDSIKGKADKRTVKAFKRLGFTVTVDSDYSYKGAFSIYKRYIHLKNKDRNVFLHELGHFLSALKGNIAKSQDFKGIYRREKKKLSGAVSCYDISSSDEYFARSYRDYIKTPKKLKKKRPKTYAFMERTIRSVSSSDIERTKAMYSWSW